MKRLTAFLMAFIISAALCCFENRNDTSDTFVKCDTLYAEDDFSEYAEQVIILVNKQREANGLSPLKTAPLLNTLAEERSEELTQVLSHTRPDGTSGLKIISSYGISYSAAGENIAAGYSTPEDVVESWMESDGHRKNILNEKFNCIGVGMVYSPGSDYEFYWTQLFYNVSVPLEDEYIPSESQQPEIIKGDVDGDGSITSYDALLVSMMVVESMEKDIEKGDLNDDGKVNMVDALIILQYISNMIDAI